MKQSKKGTRSLEMFPESKIFYRTGCSFQSPGGEIPKTPEAPMFLTIFPEENPVELGDCVHEKIKAKKPSLTFNLGNNGFRTTTNGRAGGLLARTGSLSGHARHCLIWLSCDNRCTHYTVPLAKD
ncbi:hypothetical protein J6590_030385 [Homalodisca vitripennis]|nr:hypothetical protein J6590_030385 [Homalodisca vitripennis]